MWKSSEMEGTTEKQRNARINTNRKPCMYIAHPGEMVAAPHRSAGTRRRSGMSHMPKTVYVRTYATPAAQKSRPKPNAVKLVA